MNLLFNDHFKTCKGNSVKTKKQLGYIDLLVEVAIQNENEEIKNFVLNIENKWNSNVCKLELEKYSNVLSDVYNNSNVEIISTVLFPDSLKLEENREACKINGYKMKTFKDLKVLFNDEPMTGNDLFDEFWFKFY